ncbi:MAG TPA: SUMF1/EgtB/PvdO family nonheme iron enzyme [Thermoanaerobaculia bacterium]
MPKVFLGSTHTDLQPFREAVYKAVQKLDEYRCIRMEDFGARDAVAEEFCRKAIAECDLAVFLIGLCYGSTVPGSEESYTVQEYRCAVEAGIPCLVFLSEDGHSYPTLRRESDALWQRQQDFRNRIRQERMLETFRSPEELAANVTQAIRNWEHGQRAIRDAGFFRRRTTEEEPYAEPFDHLPCPGASLADLSIEKLLSFLEKELVQVQQDFRQGAHLQEQMASFGFLRDSQPAYGALLCFGTNPQKWRPGATTHCAYWRGAVADSGWIDNQEHRGDLLSQLEGCREFLRKNLRFYRSIDDTGRQERCEIPLVALDEALANALVHREYSSRNEAVRIHLFEDRIEIISPGPPPLPLTVESMGKGDTCLRNPMVARIFYLAGHVERVGSGVPRMQRLLADAGLPPAEFGLTMAESVKVTIFRPAQTARPSMEEEGLRIEDLEAAGYTYRTHLAARYRYLDFRGMGVSDRVPLRLSLMDMYVPLKVRVEAPPGETWNRVRLAGHLGKLVPALDLLKNNNGLILLGDPGSGKTTFLKFLALAFASGRGEALGLGDRLPVLVPLSAYAQALVTGDVSLTRFIDRYYQDLGVDLPLHAVLEWKLEQGETLFLLDGLDEVKDQGQRHLVVERIRDFYSFHQRDGNKFVLTSRIVGYREVRPEAEGLAECTLVDFDDDEIKEFVERWTTALENAAGGKTAHSARLALSEREELLAAVQGNPGVRSLASNPLLLTILALMKRQGVSLPERRVELYQKYVETLLKHWNLARSLAGRSSGDLDVIKTVKVLAPLALWMHQTSPGVGLVREGDLYRELEKIFAERGHQDPSQAARWFLEDVRENAALLLDHGGRHYGFIHLTFQEYLAAVALAHKGQQGVQPIVDALATQMGEPLWHEVSLLTLGYLGIVQQRDEAVGAVLEELLRRAPGPPGEAVLLAGQTVVDIGLEGVAPASGKRVSAALLETLRDRKVNPKRRAAAGSFLGRLRDPRPGVVTLEDMELCWVPGGAFWMGGKDKSAQPVEKPYHRYDIPYEFAMSRYPVTEAQFALFLRDTRRPIVTAGTGLPNHPVTWVNWHDAVAFCQWLVKYWRKRRIVKPGWMVQLPSEAEWEKAARGTDGRIYPWGDKPDVSARANCQATDIRGTSPVGCFPDGVSPYGCEEMSGNVWEWTRSLWGDYPYPGSMRGWKKRESLVSPHPRVVRGGSFFFDDSFARCSCRLKRNPDFQRENLGFRVALVPTWDQRAERLQKRETASS